MSLNIVATVFCHSIFGIPYKVSMTVSLISFDFKTLSVHCQNMHCDSCDFISNCECNLNYLRQNVHWWQTSKFTFYPFIINAYLLKVPNVPYILDWAFQNCSTQMQDIFDIFIFSRKQKQIGGYLDLNWGGNDWNNYSKVFSQSKNNLD